MAVLLAYLLKWQSQPRRRGSSWQGTNLGKQGACPSALGPEQ
jgi:hypothetical protein